MSFIGNAPAAIPTSFQTVQADSFNGTGSAVNFTLSRQITNLYDIEVLVDNVQQSPYDGSYSVSGTTLTFSSAPSSGTNNIYVIYRDHPITSIAPRAQTIEVVSPGGGTSSLVAASSASDYTLTLPAATGTLDRLERAGNVLQVVSVTKTDVFTTTSSSFVDVTGFAATITPSSATSKILVIVSANAGANPSGVAEFRLLRGSTEILLADSSGSRSRTSFTFYHGSGNNGAAGVGTNFFDSPNTTSATTYKITMRSNTNGQIVAVNRTQDDADGASTSRATSTITLMEIAA